MLIITEKQMQEIQSMDNGVIVLDDEKAVTVPIAKSAGRPILLYAHQVAALLEADKWDAESAAARLSTIIDYKRRSGDPSWDRRRR